MATIEIIIKPHHLKGNSWTHLQNPERRHCPLQEALKETKPVVRYVGASYVSFSNEPMSITQYYDIDTSTWNQEIANKAIKDADNGSQTEYKVLLFQK